MKNNFIEFSQAILLRDIGYDEHCYAYYSDDETLNIEAVAEKSEGINLAPIYTEAFRWLSEKHNLDSSIDFIDGFYSYSIIKDGEILFEEKELSDFNLAQKKCLDKIIILIYVEI